MAVIERRGLLLVLSSPSGAGKTTLARRLLAADGDIAMSVSVTTRKQRPGEVDGRDYHFLDEARFRAMRDKGELLEWATVFGNRYGTPRAPWNRRSRRAVTCCSTSTGRLAQQLAEKMPGDIVRVFVLPPSGKVLEERLKTRNQDPSEVVAQLAEAAAEISHWAEYDYVIVNADLDRSLEGLRAILTAERLRRERLSGLMAFVRELQQAL